MIGIVVQLALSWLLLWIFQKRDLTVLGLKPSTPRLKSFLAFFSIAATCAVLAFVMRILFFHERYEINPKLTAALLWEGFRWNLVSVLYEELVFRGALLYILIMRIGARNAILISSIAFGIYHWFSYDLFGNPMAMATLFIVTGFFGWLMALAYSKTFSMYIAIGFHLGWNFTSGFIFSTGSIGNGVVRLIPGQPQLTVSFLTYYAVMLPPMALAILLGYMALKKVKAINPEARSGTHNLTPIA